MTHYCPVFAMHLSINTPPAPSISSQQVVQGEMEQMLETFFRHTESNNWIHINNF